MAGDQTPIVLIVDDDPVSRMMLSHVITQAGREVREADSVAAGLETLENTTIDLVISDFMMPEANGLDLLEAMGDSEIPFVLLTGAIEADRLDDKRVTGVDAYLTKPFASAELRKLLASLVPTSSPSPGSVRE